MHCCHSEKLPCTVLAATFPDDALGHHHPAEEAQRAKGTTALHSPFRGEEEEGRRREEKKRRAGSAREVGSSVACIINYTYVYVYIVCFKVSDFLVMYFFFSRERQRMELELLAQAVSETSVYHSICLSVEKLY